MPDTIFSQNEKDYLTTQHIARKSLLYLLKRFAVMVWIMM
jgi:hypothetical protein